MRRERVEDETRTEKHHCSMGKKRTIKRQEHVHNEDERNNTLTPHSISIR